MAILLLLALQTAAAVLGFAFLLRKQRTADAEIARLREQLAAITKSQTLHQHHAAEAVGALAQRRANIVSLRPTTPPPAPAPAPAQAAPQLGVRAEHMDIVRGLTLAIAAAVPALGLLFGWTSAATAVGLTVAAGMTALGVRREWTVAPWAGAVTAAAWALLGALLNTDPLILSAFVALVGVTGLTYARLRSLTQGAAIAGVTAAILLALSAAHGAFSAYGASFAGLIAAAAFTGASSLRHEPLFIGAFGAALAGLFVFSGQDAAAIWFTPACALTGALFFAIAAIRVPQLGQRGATLAGAGAIAPIVAAGALHSSHHGLANAYAAGGAFALIALALLGVLALAAQRRGGLSALRLTLWVLALSAFAALSAGILIAFPAPLAALSFAALSAGIAFACTRFEQAIWRVLACLAAMFASANALLSAAFAFGEAGAWPPWALVLVGIAAPCGALCAAVVFARRAGARVTRGILDAMALTLAVVSASAAIRTLFSGGALLLQPITFVETGVHIAAWLTAALLIAASGRERVRRDFALALGGLAIGASAMSALLWFTPYWSARDASGLQAPIGFLAPALLYWVHWVFWRGRGAVLQTRIALGAAAASSAAYVTLELIRQPEMPTWATAILCGAVVSFAVAINFAPGVVAPQTERTYRSHKRRRYSKSA